MLLHRLFWGDRRGNVAIIFALAMVPVAGVVGATVDYSRAGSVRASLQGAVDATALALSKQAVDLTDAQFQKLGQDYFKGVFNHPSARDVLVTPSFAMKDGTFTVRVEASLKLDTIIARLVGQAEVEIGAVSEVVWGMKRLELALVLDNTTSMAEQSRMVELKKATKNLLETLKKAAQKPDDIKVAIIPYGTEVNVGTGNVNAAWLDWSSWEAEPPIMASWLKNSTNKKKWDDTGPDSACPFTTKDHGFGCSSGPASTSNDSTVSKVPKSGTHAGLICPSRDDGSKGNATTGVLTGVYHNGCYTSVPTTTTTTSKQTVCSGSSSCSCSGQSNCSCSGSGKNKVCTKTVSTTTTGAPYTHAWVPNARSTWNGCVRDRAQDYDVDDTTPGLSNSTRFQPHQAQNCSGSAGLASILSLTNDWTTLNARVEQMNTGGGTSGSRATNITIGLAWGWHALFKNEPLTQAEDPKDDLDKVIILMTDGDNTQNRWNKFNADNSAVDDRTELACANAKKAGIRVYTVRLMQGNETLLKNCATELKMYYNVEQATQLNAAFSAIAQNLSNLRIAR